MWEPPHRDYKDAITKTFRQTAISLPPDGSKDEEIRIRDIPNIEIGDYNREEVMEIDSTRLLPLLRTSLQLNNFLQESGSNAERNDGLRIGLKRLAVTLAIPRAAMTVITPMTTTKTLD